MSNQEIILKWAELLLQGQVLGFFLAIIAFCVWRKELSQLIKAIAKKGGKFSAGPVSGEIGAGAQEGAMPINSDDSGGNEQVQMENISDPEQWKVIQRLALRFEDIVKSGSSERSYFVDEIRSEYSSGWSWSFIENALENEPMSVRFCAAALLTSKGVNFESARLAQFLKRESSSLVRYRLIEALLYWATSLNVTDDEKNLVSRIIREHTEENRYVGEKLNELVRILSR